MQDNSVAAINVLRAILRVLVASRKKPTAQNITFAAKKLLLSGRVSKVSQDILDHILKDIRAYGNESKWIPKINSILIQNRSYFAGKKKFKRGQEASGAGDVIRRRVINAIVNALIKNKIPRPSTSGVVNIINLLLEKNRIRTEEGRQEAMIIKKSILAKSQLGRTYHIDIMNRWNMKMQNSAL